LLTLLLNFCRLFRLQNLFLHCLWNLFLDLLRLLETRVMLLITRVFCLFFSWCLCKLRTNIFVFTIIIIIYTTLIWSIWMTILKLTLFLVSLLFCYILTHSSFKDSLRCPVIVPSFTWGSASPLYYAHCIRLLLVTLRNFLWAVVFDGWSEQIYLQMLEGAVLLLARLFFKGTPNFSMINSTIFAVWAAERLW
jgi:hypothetical protein